MWRFLAVAGVLLMIDFNRPADAAGWHPHDMVAPMHDTILCPNSWAEKQVVRFESGSPEDNGIIQGNHCVDVPGPEAGQSLSDHEATSPFHFQVVSEFQWGLTIVLMSYQGAQGPDYGVYFANRRSFGLLMTAQP